jgi:murein DD-endopeptidase MepM/ murein hydrolase activator NlpD
LGLQGKHSRIFESQQINPRERLHRVRVRRYAAVVAVLTLVIAAIIVFKSRPATSENDDLTTIQIYNTPSAVRGEALEPTANAVEVMDVSVKANDTLYTILREFNVPPEDITRMARLSRRVYDLARLRKGDTLKVSMLEKDLKAVEYRYNEFDGMRLRKDASAESGFAIEKFIVPHETRLTASFGTVENSLYGAGLKAGADPSVMVALSDIFAWDIDFSSDIKSGDTFKVLYETVYSDDKPVRSGRILAAEMVSEGKRYAAYYHVNDKGKGEYYDENGKALSRTLLKSPLRFRRVSSHFSSRRFHPIQRRFRPHHGVDYAAPTGTPIEAAGDGRVMYAGWKGGYGRYVLIKHNGTYSTAYGHLSSIAKGIRPGASVSQGQLIGKVGSSGNSTGPHLHYEIHVRGRMVNPLSIKAESSKKLTGNALASFKSVRDDLTAKLTAAEAGSAFARNAAQ